MNMYIIVGLLFVVALLVGAIVGFSLGTDFFPTIGRLDVNTSDPSKEMMALIFEKDVDFEQPPKKVTLKLVVK